MTVAPLAVRRRAARLRAARGARRSSTSTAARPTPRGARAWRSASRRRRAPRSRSCRRRPARCSRRSRPKRANPKGDIWWAGAADAYLQAAEEGLLEAYRSPNVDAALRLGAAHLRRVEEPRLRRLRRHPRARLQHRDHGEEEAAGAEVLEGSARSRLQGRGHARQSELVRHRVPDARDAGAGVRRGRGVQVHGGASTRTSASTRARASGR